MDSSGNFTRRDALKLAGWGGLSGWLMPLARAMAAEQRKKSLIILWMDGGPATIDLWDLKPKHENGGPFKPIATTAPGLEISENLPKMAQWGKHLSVIRSMTSKEGDHSRGSHLMRVGYTPQGAIQFPTFSAAVARELRQQTVSKSLLPPYVAVSPQGERFSELGGGFLGPAYDPLTLGGSVTASVEEALQVPFLQPQGGGTASDHQARLEMLYRMNSRFFQDFSSAAVEKRAAAVQTAADLMSKEAASSFQLNEEPEALRDRYGRNRFGQGLLLARRLIERGVSCVEVALSGWDTHSDNFNRVKDLAQTVDNAWSSLMTDLQARGMLDSTLILWMGEFGRTPKINPSTGRDHWPQSFSTVLAGGGIAGGQAIGATSDDGMKVEERPVSPPDLLATVAKALGIDPKKQNMSNVSRPIRVVDPSAQAVDEVLL